MSIFIILCFLLTLIYGCETTAMGLGGAAVGAAEGAKRDWCNLKKVDAWMRKNLW
jgi:hypothetical protein